MSKQHAARPNPAQAELQRQATKVRSGGTRYIFARTGMKSRRCHRLSSNLRRQIQRAVRQTHARRFRGYRQNCFMTWTRNQDDH